MKRTTALETALRLNDSGRRNAARLACTCLPRRQRGIALVMTLVFLTILIILALASMSTTTLEERMSGNMQDMYHAFQAADSSLKSALSDADAKADTTITTTITPSYTYGSSTISRSTVSTTFRQFTPVDPGSGTDIYSKNEGGGFQMGTFDQLARATGPGNSAVTIRQGMEQVVPKPQ